LIVGVERGGITTTPTAGVRLGGAWRVAGAAVGTLPVRGAPVLDGARARVSFAAPSPCGFASESDGVARIFSPKRARSAATPSAIRRSTSVTPRF
jgi:hypothetical protein